MSTKLPLRQNSRVNKIPVSTKSRCRQNLGIDKMLAQTQKNPLTVWLGRVHSCWLFPDLAEDLLRLLDGVDLFACCRHAWRLWLPCFYGRTLYDFAVSVHHAENVTNFGAAKYRCPPKFHHFSLPPVLVSKSIHTLSFGLSFAYLHAGCEILFRLIMDRDDRNSIYERFIYSQHRSTYLAAANRQTDPGNI